MRFYLQLNFWPIEVARRCDEQNLSFSSFCTMADGVPVKLVGSWPRHGRAYWAESDGSNDPFGFSSKCVPPVLELHHHRMKSGETSFADHYALQSQMARDSVGARIASNC